MTKLNSKQKLTTWMIELIKSTPFWHFLESSKVIVDIALLEDLCSCWVEGNKFHFGGDQGRFLGIKPEDASHILEFPYTRCLVELDH